MKVMAFLPFFSTLMLRVSLSLFFYFFRLQKGLHGNRKKKKRRKKEETNKAGKETDTNRNLKRTYRLQALYLGYSN